eukprot:2915244-Prymnesium_polylepis.1
MRAISYNGTHICAFLNGESVCAPSQDYRCPRVKGLYVAPLSSTSANLYAMEMAPIRTFSPALSEPALQRIFYSERIHYNTHIEGPKKTDTQMAARLATNLLSYPGRVFNFVPPLMFQSRYNSVIDCEGFAAASEAVFRDQRRQRCRGYGCQDE